MRRVSKIALSTLLLVLALGSSAQAAVTFDCKMESGAGSQASPFSYVSNAATVACTPAATSNRVLIGFVALRRGRVVRRDDLEQRHHDPDRLRQQHGRRVSTISICSG
jgi:hypothetical protein